MIEVRGLVKEYAVMRHHRGFWGSLRNLVETRRDVVRAVQGIDFTVEAGEFVGFVGPNGAGKSTTIRILMSMVVQDRGTVRVLGRVMPREQAAAKQDIGFQGGHGIATSDDGSGDRRRQ